MTEKNGKGLIAGMLVLFALIITAIVVFLVIWTRKKGKYVFVKSAGRSLNRNVQNRRVFLLKIRV